MPKTTGTKKRLTEAERLKNYTGPHFPKVDKPRKPPTKRDPTAPIPKSRTRGVTKPKSTPKAKKEEPETESK